MCVYNSENGGLSSTGKLWKKLDPVGGGAWLKANQKSETMAALNDPFNLMGAQTANQAQKEYRAEQRMYANAPKLQKDINRRYGLNGQHTILGG